MENTATGSDYQVIRFHRGRPSSTSERDDINSPDLEEDNSSRKSKMDGHQDLDDLAKKSDKPSEAK